MGGGPGSRPPWAACALSGRARGSSGADRALGGSPPPSGTVFPLEQVFGEGFPRGGLPAAVAGAAAGRRLPGKAPSATANTGRKAFPDPTGWVRPASTPDAQELGCKDSRSGRRRWNGLCAADLGSSRTVYLFPG